MKSKKGLKYFRTMRKLTSIYNRKPGRLISLGRKIGTIKLSLSPVEEDLHTSWESILEEHRR